MPEGIVFDFKWSPPLPKGDLSKRKAKWLAGQPVVHRAVWNSNSATFELVGYPSLDVHWEWEFGDHEAAESSLGGWDFTMADAALCQLVRQYAWEPTPELLRAEGRVTDWLRAMFEISKQLDKIRRTRAK